MVSRGPFFCFGRILLSVVECTAPQRCRLTSLDVFLERVWPDLLDAACSRSDNLDWERARAFNNFFSNEVGMSARFVTGRIWLPLVIAAVFCCAQEGRAQNKAPQRAGQP